MSGRKSGKTASVTEVAMGPSDNLAVIALRTRVCWPEAVATDL
jgi:hypothetical protein